MAQLYGDDSDPAVRRQNFLIELDALRRSKNPYLQSPWPPADARSNPFLKPETVYTHTKEKQNG